MAGKQGARRRWLWALSGIMVVLVAAAGVVVANPPAPPMGPLLGQSTAEFSEEEALAWKGDELGQADPVKGFSLATKAMGVGGQTMYGWGNGAHNVFTGDFNKDGKWDIGVTGTDKQNERCWYIRYGQGNGQFGKQTQYCWGNGVTNVFSGDFNGDGYWDIGVTGTSAQKERNWYIRYGDGKGNFGNQTMYAWGNGVTNVFTGDFNGDGKWDIGVTGTEAERERTWYIRYGDGRGNFGNETRYTWNNGVTNVFTGDFNGDGKWDIGVTGTSGQRDRCWYIRVGDGKGQFGEQFEYCWGNGVTNAFAGDFNGDGMWDLGVTGDQVQRDGNWYIRYNSMKKATPTPPQTPPGQNPPQNDATAQLGRNLATQAYQYLLGRAATEAEKNDFIAKLRAGTKAEDLWTSVARSQERLNKYGFFAPSYGAYNGKTELCFGAVGNKCDGVWLATPDVQWINPFERADGKRMAYVRIAVAVGSILHDNICLENPLGAWCSGLPTAITGEIPLMRVLGPASMEWNKAVYNTRDGRYWMATFGPYPVDKSAQQGWSDDLTIVAARPSKMARILPVGAMPVVSEPYRGKETRQTKVLKAPGGAYVDREDQAFCASGKYTEEGQWWTAQWWGKCN